MRIGILFHLQTAHPNHLGRYGNAPPELRSTRRESTPHVSSFSYPQQQRKKLSRNVRLLQDRELMLPQHLFGYLIILHAQTDNRFAIRVRNK